MRQCVGWFSDEATRAHTESPPGCGNDDSLKGSEEEEEEKKKKAAGGEEEEEEEEELKIKNCGQDGGARCSGDNECK